MELTIEQRKKILDYIEDRWEYDCCYDKEIDLGNELRVEIDADGEGATLSFWTDEDTEVEVEGIRKLEDEIMDLEQAAKEYSERIALFHGCLLQSQYATGLENGFKAGAKWMAKQIKGGSK